MEATTATRPKKRLFRNLKPLQATDRSEPLTLRKNFSWTMLGSIFYNLCQFGLLVAITKIGTTQMAGQYTIGLAITAPVMIFLGFNLRAVIVSDARRECPFGIYLAFRLLAVTTAICVIAVIVYMAGYRYETAVVILMIGFAKGIEAISAIFFGYFQQNERMDQIAISRIAKGILSLLFFVNGMWFSGSVVGGVAGLAIAWLTTLVCFDIPRAVHLSKHRVEYRGASRESFWPRWDFRQLGKLFILAFPLGIVVMLVSLNVNIPRYFVEAWYGEEVLGIFGPISYFMVLGNQVVMALGQSAAPRMARNYMERDRSAVILLLLKQKAVGACVGIIGVSLVAVAGPLILSIAFGPEYAKYDRVFMLLMMASGISLIFGFSNMFLTAARAFWIQIPLRICTLSTMVICCTVFVPSFGLVGAAMSMLISMSVHATLTATATIIIIHRMQDSEKVGNRMQDLSKPAPLSGGPHSISPTNTVTTAIFVPETNPMSAESIDSQSTYN